MLGGLALVVGLGFPAAAQICPPTFGAPLQLPTGGDATAVVAVDLNGDGLLDLVTKNYAYTPEAAFSAFLGGPGGTFGPDLQPSLGSLQNLVAGDFTGDGKQDVAGWWNNGYSTDIGVVPGNGDGTFGDPIVTHVGFRPWAVAAGDFNGDGRLDLAVADYDGAQVGILLGASTPGTFLPPTTMQAVGSHPVQVLLVDLNGDGILDVVTVNSDSNDLSVLLGSALSLQPAVSYPLGGSPSRGVFADFNGDSKVDLAVQNSYPGAISILLGNGAGGFSTVATLAAPSSDGLAAGDFNGDGRVDLASCPYADYDRLVQLWVGTGDATLFAPGPRLPFRLFVVPEMLAADLDGDGDSDLVLAAWDSRLEVLKNTAGEPGGVGIAAPSYPICPGSTQGAEAPDYGPTATYLWSITNGYLPEGTETQRNVWFSTWDPGTPGAKTALDVTIQLPGCPPIAGHAEMGFNPVPRGDMTAPDEVCPASAGNTASVPDAGAGASYQWSLYNGTLTSGQGTREITFTAGPANNGPMNVYCNVTNSSFCSGGYGKGVSIRPQAWFQINQSICAGGVGTTTVEDQGPGATYTWEIVDGTILAGQGTPTVSFTSAHTPYTDVSLTVRSAAGCSATWTTNLFVVPPPSTVITSAATVCAGSAGNVASVPDAGTGATYQWSVTNGTLTSNLYGRTVTYTAGPSGTTTLSVSVGRTSYAPCTASSSRAVAIDSPTAVVTAPAAICAGATGAASVADAGTGATYAWTISNGTITVGSGTRSIGFTAATSGTVALGVTVTSGAGCAASGSQNVAIDATPSAVIVAPSALCAGASGGASVADGGAGANYTWTITNGTITSGAGTSGVAFTAGQAGTVTLACRVALNGCSSTESVGIPIQVRPPTPSIYLPSLLCAGWAGNVAFLFGAVPGATYHWTVQGGTLTSGDGTTSIQFTAGASGAVSLSVYGETAPGCSGGTATASSPIYAPDTDFYLYGPICEGGSSYATASDAGPNANYTWSISNGTITGGQGTRTVFFTAGPAGRLDVTLAIGNNIGCPPVTRTKSIDVVSRPSTAINAPAVVCSRGSGTVSVADAGPGATYTWSVTGGATITSGGTSRSMTFLAGTWGPVGLTVAVRIGSCVQSGSVSVPVEQVVADITTPSSICTASASNVASVPDAGAGATYAWTITNGTITSGAGTSSISYTAGVAGVHAILQVTVQSAAGCAETRSTDVVVNPLPSPYLQPPLSICPGGTSTLTVVDGSASTYTWSVTNGTIASGAGTRQVTFTAGTSGSVTVSVAMVGSTGCTSSATYTVPISTPPSTTISAPASTCPNASSVPASVPDAGQGATYSWTITNGTITSGAGSRSMRFTAGPSGSVSLGVNVQSATGCAADGSSSVAVDPAPSVAITAPSAICTEGAGAASVASAGTGATYSWTITNGTITGGAGTASITFAAGTSGSTGLSVTVQTGAGCSGTASQSVAINASPSTTITTPAGVCAGGVGVASVADAGAGATYAWTITNGSITGGAGTRSITFSAGASGPIALGVTVQTGASCAATGSRSVAVNPIPSAAISAPAAICAGATGAASVTDAGAGASYSWTITNGSITSGAGTRSIAFIPGPSGSVSLGMTVLSGAGCGASASASVTINAAPSATITAPAALCVGAAGSASVVDGGAGASYAWTITNGTLTSGAGTRNVAFTAGSSGPVGLGVTVQNAAGCAASDSQNVAVDAAPSAAITAPAAVCPSSTGNAASVPDAGAGATYTWSITGGSITGGAGTRAITFTAPASGTATLSVTVRTSAGCQNSGSLNVAVSGLPSATVTAPSSVCASSPGNAASVPDAGAGGTYTWTITNGTITGGAGTRSVTFTAGPSGTVALGVTVRNGTGCARSGTKNVSTTALPSATISAPSSVRTNKTGSASVPSAGTGATYAWTITNGTITGGAGTRTISFRAGSPGTMTLGVVVTKSGGCGASGTRNVTVTN